MGAACGRLRFSEHNGCGVSAPFVSLCTDVCEFSLLTAGHSVDVFCC